MKKSLVLILILHLSFSKVNADTVDFYHVFYNNELILESGVYGTSTITLALIDLQDTDTLYFNYFNDTGRYDLIHGCILRSNNAVIFRATQKPSSGEYAIPVSLIKQHFLNTGSKAFEIWYYNKFFLTIELE